MQRLQMSGSSSSSISRQQQLSEAPQINGPYQHFSPNSFSLEASKSSGNSPSHNPPSPISPSPSGSHNLYSVPCHHSHSLSQPTFFFSLDSLPPPPPPHHHQKSTPASSLSGSTEAGDGCPPPRKLHCRSKSEIPSGFLQSPPPPPMAAVSPQPLESGKKESNWVQDAEGIRERKSKDEVGDDLFHEYMNLDSLETLNSSEDKRGSGRSEKEGESSGSIQLKIPFSTALHHCTSVSMDCLMGKLHFGDESPRLPPFSACRASQHSRGNSMDGTSNAFTLELENGEFSCAEVEKIMANEKLAEIALTNPKRAKRILANRQSAARSKERNLRYISELERKVQTLQTEATTLSAQLTLLQRDSAGLTSQNNELNFRLQSMEQHAQLRDALNEALTAEVQHLKLATANVGDAYPSHSSTQQISINPQMFQLQQQQQQSIH